MVRRLAMVLASLLVGAGVLAEEPERFRGLLYRVDAEARTARLHTGQALEHAKAAQRFAHRLGDSVGGDPALAAQGERVEQAADRLAQAAQRREDEDVRAAAVDLQAELRRLDEALANVPR